MRAGEPARTESGFEAAERLARSLMFEGYVLYPYRRSSLKNMQRFSFGTLHGKAHCAPGTSDAASLRVECLLRGQEPILDLSARFLHHVKRLDAGNPEPWVEAIERACPCPGIDVAALARGGAPHAMIFDHMFLGQRADDGRDARRSDDVCVHVEVRAQRFCAPLFKLQIEVENTSRGHDALLCALGSMHVLLQAKGGEFVSLLEPPRELAQYAATCRSTGCFPVLVGEPDQNEVMLASPIILYDRPMIAPESAGDFCDATEIDEMLSLRVLTLTEDERREAARTDARCRAIIERTHAQNDDALLALHGARRTPSVSRPATLEPPRHAPRAHAFAPGDAVRIRPTKGGDIFDLALAGERATVVSVEEDFEGRVHYAVTVDADPGRDLGAAGMPGHRFFFSEQELERVP